MVQMTNLSSTVMLAASLGSLDMLQKLCDMPHYGPSMLGTYSAVGSDGETALHFASAAGHLDVVKWLVEEKGLNVNVVTNRQQSSALLDAAAGGHADVAAFLVQAGADVTVVNIQREGFLFLAARAGSPECVTLALQHGADQIAPNVNGQSPLQGAAWAGSLDCLALLVEAGLPEGATGPGGLLQSAAINAAAAGHVHAVRWLEEHGAYDGLAPGTPHPGHVTLPVHAAAAAGSIELLQMLAPRDGGRRGTCLNDSGNSPLINATGCIGSYDLAARQRARAASVWLLHNGFYTPGTDGDALDGLLVVHAHEGDLGLVRLLLGLGADVEKTVHFQGRHVMDDGTVTTAAVFETPAAAAERGLHPAVAEEIRGWAHFGRFRRQALLSRVSRRQSR